MLQKLRDAGRHPNIIPLIGAGFIEEETDSVLVFLKIPFLHFHAHCGLSLQEGMSEVTVFMAMPLVLKTLEMAIEAGHQMVGRTTTCQKHRYRL